MQCALRLLPAAEGLQVDAQRQQVMSFQQYIYVCAYAELLWLSSSMRASLNRGQRQPVLHLPSALGAPRTAAQPQLSDCTSSPLASAGTQPGRCCQGAGATQCSAGHMQLEAAAARTAPAACCRGPPSGCAAPASQVIPGEALCAQTRVMSTAAHHPSLRCPSVGGRSRAEGTGSLCCTCPLLHSHHPLMSRHSTSAVPASVNAARSCSSTAARLLQPSCSCYAVFGRALEARDSCSAYCTCCLLDNDSLQNNAQRQLASRLTKVALCAQRDAD